MNVCMVIFHSDTTKIFHDATLHAPWAHGKTQSLSVGQSRSVSICLSASLTTWRQRKCKPFLWLCAVEHWGDAHPQAKLLSDGVPTPLNNEDAYMI